MRIRVQLLAPHRATLKLNQIPKSVAQAVFELWQVGGRDPFPGEQLQGFTTLPVKSFFITANTIFP